VKKHADKDSAVCKFKLFTRICNLFLIGNALFPRAAVHFGWAPLRPDSFAGLENVCVGFDL
jgi:hypothetical protein